MTFRIVRRSRVFSTRQLKPHGPGPDPVRVSDREPLPGAGGTAGPARRRRISAASRAESGIIGIFGRIADSDSGMRRAEAVDAQPGVSGSPGTRKS